MSFPAILIPDHLEVALVRSTSKLFGNASRLIRLNGDWQADDFQMRGAGGKAQINDMGLLTQIGIEKSILLTGDITASDDNHKKSNSMRLDTAVIRALGANIVNAVPLIAAIRELPSLYSENLPLDLQNKFETILKSISMILNLNALTILPSGEASISELINKEFENLLEIIGDNLSDFMQSFPSLLLPLLEVITPAIERYASPQNLQIFGDLSIKIENIMQYINSLELTNDKALHETNLPGIEPLKAESAVSPESETQEVADITEEKSEIGEAEVEGERDDVEIELANDNDAETLKVTEEPIINSEIIELEYAEPEQASALDLELPDAISEHNIALGAILSINPNPDSFTKDAVSVVTSFRAENLNDNSSVSPTLTSVKEISPSLQMPIDTKEIVSAVNSAPFNMPIKFEALNNNNNSIPLRSSTNAPVQTTMTDRPQARFAFSQQSIMPSVNRVSSLPTAPVNIPSGLQTIMPIASMGIASARLVVPSPTVSTVPPNQPKIQSQPLPQLKPKPQDQAPAIPVKPPIPKQNPIAPERTKTFVQNVPEKLKEAAVLIRKIMDPNNLQLPPNFKPIAANNNVSLKPVPLNDENTRRLKDRIRINFEKVTNSVTETIKQKAKELHERLKNNPAVGAVCAISGGICRCTERFNRAARGILDSATRKLLEENNITEKEYIDEAKSQKELGEILAQYRSPDQDRKSNEGDERIRRALKGDKDSGTNEAHVHTADCFKPGGHLVDDADRKKDFENILRQANNASAPPKNNDNDATAGMTARQRREAKAKAEQSTNQSTPQFK